MVFFFFFNETATTEIYTYGHTLSLHDALPIFHVLADGRDMAGQDVLHGRARRVGRGEQRLDAVARLKRSEEHTSELQSLMRISYAVFCLKKQTQYARCRSPPLLTLQQRSP